MKKPLISLIVILVLGIAADQGSKQWAQHNLLGEGFHANTAGYSACGTPEQENLRSRFVYRNAEPEKVVNNLFNLRYVENCASSFNLMGNMPEWFRFPFFLIISILACLIIPYMYVKTPVSQRLMLYALPFILAGAMGNLLDRMLFRYVIDFIDWYVVIGGREYHWPTFNIADAAIVIGIGLMVLQLVIGETPAEKNPDKSEAPAKDSVN